MRQASFAALLAVCLLTAACDGQPATPTLNPNAIALAVQQTQTAAAAATGPVPAPASPTQVAVEAASATSTAPATAAASETPTPTPSQAPSGTPGAGPVYGPTSETPGQPATITGALGYPSEVIPRLRVYAWDRESGQWRYVITNQNDSTYTLPVPPGRYVVFAYLNDGGALAAGYTNAVPCGLSAGCADHTLIVVSVGSGQQASGVNVTDWYGPPGFIPQPPG